MDPRYNLVTSVQTWVPRATDVANSILFGAFSTVNETGPGPQDPPSDDDGLDKWETIALGVASAFAVTALGYLLYAVIAHFCASGKKSKKDKDFVERAGESAKDRAKRYKHWAEDRAEEGQGVFHDVEDWFEHAGEDIKEAAEEVKDKVKELFTGKDKVSASFPRYPLISSLYILTTVTEGRQEQEQEQG